MSPIEIVAILIAVALVGLAQWLLRRWMHSKATAFVLEVYENETRVLDSKDVLMFTIPNTIAVEDRKGKPRYVDYGVGKNEKPGHAATVRVLDLGKQEQRVQSVEGLWRAFVGYCLFRARKECGASSWFPLRVTIDLKATNPALRSSFLREITPRNLRTFGTVDVREG